jgi:hypothetical protein
LKRKGGDHEIFKKESIHNTMFFGSFFSLVGGDGQDQDFLAN